MVSNSGNAKTLGDLNGEKMDTSESLGELMNLELKIKEKVLFLILFIKIYHQVYDLTILFGLLLYSEYIK